MDPKLTAQQAAAHENRMLVMFCAVFKLKRIRLSWEWQPDALEWLEDDQLFSDAAGHDEGKVDALLRVLEEAMC